MNDEERKRIREECNRVIDNSMMAVYAGPVVMQNIEMMMVYAGPGPMVKDQNAFKTMMDMQKEQEDASVNAAAGKKQIREGIYSVCPGCGACASTKFCPECGTLLANEEKYRDCLMCGTRLAAADKFCRECGAQQNAEGTAKV